MEPYKSGKQSGSKQSGTRFCYLVILIPILLFLPGCVATKMAGNISSTIRGDYYLDKADTTSGINHFRKQVAEDPGNPLNNYYLGRLLLRENRYKEALTYLTKASKLEPENSNYKFWTGVAHGSLKQYKSERARYREAVLLQPDNQQALTALGHSYMRGRSYTNALKTYDKALKLWPDNPSARYNKALALTKLGRTKQAKAAWRRYLSITTSGALAAKAVDHLNTLGDFTYRNYTIGPRTISVKAIQFDPTTGSTLTRESISTLKQIGKVAEAIPRGSLQVLVYSKGNKQLAKQRALAIRKALLQHVPGLGKERIGFSWFNKSQILRSKRKRINQSIDFFLRTKQLK